MGWKAVLALLLFAGSGEDAAIREVMAQQQEAWNRGDIPGFMRAYENSPDTTFVGKDVTRGYQPVLDRYLKRYPTREAMGELTFSELEIHLIGSGHAWAMGRFTLKRTAAGGGDATGRFTLVLKKTKSGWKVILDHTN
jgi:ketosteroid isomerase-like protein